MLHVVKWGVMSHESREVDLPVNCFYKENLSTYGRGYVDGMLDAFNHLPVHASIKRTQNDSDTRRAYVAGYQDGYSDNRLS
jgi:hypothetical protein